MPKQKDQNRMMGFSTLGIVISVVVFAVIAGSIGLYLYQRQQLAPKVETAAVQRRDLKQVVSVTGNVQPIQKANLSFEVSGKTALILADVGDQVKAGDPIIKLENSDLTAQLAQAQADLSQQQALLDQSKATVKAQQAQYDEMLRGATPEDLQIAETKVSNAEQELSDAVTTKENTVQENTKTIDNAYQTASDLLNQASTVFDRVLYSRTQNFFTSGTGEKKLTFTISDPQVETDATTQRGGAESRAAQLKQALSSGITHAQIDALLSQTITNLDYLQQYLFTLNKALDTELTLDATTDATYSTNVDQSLADVAAIQNSLSAQKQAIALDIIALQTATDSAQAKVTIAQNALTLAQNELSKVLAGSTKEQLDAQKAKVDEAQAGIASQLARIQAANAQIQVIRAQLAKTVLRSPIDGIVTKQETKLGETVQPQQIIAAVSSEQKFEITANVPEVDIANIRVGNTADVTLDAYGPDVHFAASVVKIDPAEIVIEGVSTYKVTLHFVQEDARIRSGMTANTDILTSEVKNALSIPQRAVTEANGVSTVQIYVNNQVSEQTITTGITSWDGYAEIKSGLNEGDQVVTFISS